MRLGLGGGRGANILPGPPEYASDLGEGGTPMSSLVPLNTTRIRGGRGANVLPGPPEYALGHEAQSAFLYLYLCPTDPEREIAIAMGLEDTRWIKSKV